MFKRPWLWGLAALLIVALVGLLAGGSLSAQAASAETKIAPHLWAATADGAEAEFFVVLAARGDLSPAQVLPDKAAKGQFVFDTLQATAKQSQAPLRGWLEAQGVAYRSFYIVNALLLRGDRALVQALAARPEVARIEANPTIRHTLPQTVGDSRAPHQLLAIEPGVAYINADDVWNLGFTGQGIVVGGQDTGYDWDHPALINQYRGWNGSSASHDYNWHDAIHVANSDCPADSTQPCDDDSHGTHTMGTAVGWDGGANQVGVAPGAEWIGCRNMNDGNGTPATYLECFEFFLAPYPVGGSPAQGDPSKAPDVTINSWSCPPVEGCAADTLQAAVEAQVAAGIMTVTSAGNNGSACSSVLYPPGTYAASYSVGALVTGTDALASFSSRGPVTVDGSNRLKPDISAPGTGTRSSIPGGGYGAKSGTSMAAPHVSGAVALLLSARPDLLGQPAQIRAVLNQSAFHVSDLGCGGDPSGWPNNRFGYGRLDAFAAVNAVLGVDEEWLLFLPLVLR